MNALSDEVVPEDIAWPPEVPKRERLPGDGLTAEDLYGPGYRSVNEFGMQCVYRLEKRLPAGELFIRRNGLPVPISSAETHPTVPGKRGTRSILFGPWIAL